MIKLLVDEPGAEEARSAYSEADGIRTTAIARVEATAALARMRKGKRLTPAQLNRALDDLENIWRGIFSHAVDDSLLAKAAENARAHSLRAYGRRPSRWSALLRGRREARLRLLGPRATGSRGEARLPINP